MPPLEIPANYEDITPEWLTQALRDNGTLQDAALTSINAAPLGEQRGFTGIIVRFELEYDRDEDGAPATLVGKFPSLNRFDNPDPEAIEFIGRIYQGEIRFYREIAPHAPIRTPHFYYGDADPESGRAALLIEDLSDAQPPDPEIGFTPEQLRLIVANIARFHAAFWDNAPLAAIDWLNHDGADLEAVVENFETRWPTSQEKFGEKFALLLQLGTQLKPKLPELFPLWSAEPHTLLHFDYHGRNMLFRGDEQIVYDWQAPIKGKGPNDVAYFFTLSVETEKRRALERELLRLYHATLVENGVEDYDLDQCLSDFRLMLVRVLARLLVILAILDFSDETDGIADMLNARMEAIMADYDIGDLLS